MPIQTLNAACDLLGITQFERENLTMEVVKRQYRKYALKYHPDKNVSPDAGNQFISIQEANEYLSKYLEGGNEYDLEDWGDFAGEYFSPNGYFHGDKQTYKSIFVNFIYHLLKGNNKLTLILSKLAGLCENTALEYLRKIEKHTLSKIYEVAKQQNDVFHFSEEFLESIREILDEKEKNEEIIILNPHLDDLLKDQLYKLTYRGQVFIIPLWHNELVYDISGCDFTVKCCPILPDNMELDEYNNLEVELHYSIEELWEKDEIEVKLGSKSVFFVPKMLRLVPFQCVVLKGEGILAIHPKKIYDETVRMDVILNIHIYCITSRDNTCLS